MFNKMVIQILHSLEVKSNIVEIDELKELKVWFEDCIKDYFDNVMTLDYKEF